MQLYNAVIVCKRDENLIPWHVEHVDALGIPMQRCFYYGMELDGWRPAAQSNVHVVPFWDVYENLPLKTYGAVKHALTIPGWTHLLKSDVNSYPSFIDLAKLETHNMLGYRSIIRAGDSHHSTKVFEPGMAEPYKRHMPTVWCGGCAYVISRLLAMKIAERGAWYARGWAYEDVMVSQIATEEGWVPETGVGYWTEGKDWRN